MTLKKFSDLEAIVKGRPAKRRILVAAAHDEHTLDGINEAFAGGMIEPVLIGDERKINGIIEARSLMIGGAETVHASDDEACAKKAAEMAASGYGDAIMKGKLQTADLLREVVDKNNGLIAGDIMSHVGLFQVPTYHKLFALTDGGMVMAPDLSQKRMILDNAVRTLHALGTDKPKVAALCATETVNPKMRASVDAAEMKRLNMKGEIKGCIVEGPISFDLMYDAESAKVKGYDSPVAGDADILLMPDMTAGNLVAKSLMLAAGGMMAGLIVGAKLPIVLVSRGASAEEKYWSLVFAAAVS
ncbi:MAG: phosphate butyryltransferase [Clostridiales Family XIII bacterium]|jgi:phosphate butyryltransferase|nr:phosphate butyryltransferase [Clostridiales Family XIII bacterium]